MPSQPPIPPLLRPYLPLPPSSLILITSTLSTTPTFLLLRFLSSTLSNPDNHPGLVHTEPNPLHIILQSWLRDFPFFRDGAKKLGLDLADKRKVTFIDGLGTGLGLGAEGIKGVEKGLLDAVRKAKDGDEAKERKIIVMMDGLDIFLAATGISVEAVLDMVAEVRENIDSLILTLSADAPLLHTRQTPLEINNASLAMSLAHQARLLMGVRELDTGVARDVSGVLRIGRGGGEGAEDIEEKEVLYFVCGDGGLRVFERGA